MSKPFLLLLSLFSVATLHGQVLQTARIEFEKKEKFEEQYEIIPLANSGLIFTKKRQEYNSKNNNWEFIKLNTAFAEKWKSEYTVPKGQFPLLNYQNKNYLYWLFAEPEDKTAITILKLNIENGETEEIKGDLFAVNEVSHFMVMGTKAYFGGKFQQKPVVAIFNFFDGGNKVLPGLFKKDTFLNDLKINEEEQEVIVTTQTQTIRTECELSVFQFNEDGKLMKTRNFPMEGQKNLLSAQVVQIDKESSFLVGNYAQNCGYLSSGMYLASGQEDSIIKYLDFANFEHFFDYLSPKRQDKMLEKINRKKDQGKETNLKYNLLFHEFKKTKQGIILLAEVYYPSYSSQSANTSLVNTGSLIGRRFESVPNAYKFSHAIVCGLDKNGKLLWDQSFAMKDLESSNLNYKIELNEVGNKLVLAYPDEDKIVSKTIENGKIVHENETIEIKPQNPNERVRWTENNSIIAWYENHFLAFGYQRIENINNNELKSREVFYINKISFKGQ